MTRKRRYLISAAVLVACVCIALGVLAMLPAQPGVTKSNFDRVEKGMALAEVEAIFGCTPDLQGYETGGKQTSRHVSSIWFGDDKSRCTIMHPRGVVTESNWTPSTETFTAKLRRWLHLPASD